MTNFHPGDLIRINRRDGIWIVHSIGGDGSRLHVRRPLANGLTHGITAGVGDAVLWHRPNLNVGRDDLYHEGHRVVITGHPDDQHVEVQLPARDWPVPSMPDLKLKYGETHSIIGRADLVGGNIGKFLKEAQ